MIGFALVQRNATALSRSNEQRCKLGVIHFVHWLNISYNDPVVKRKVEAACGKGIGLWEAIRMGGAGSPRMVLIAASHGLMDPFDRMEDRRTCSIELRKGGLLLHCRSRLETMGLPIGESALVEIILQVPGRDPHGELFIGLMNGSSLRLEVPKEHWGTLSRLLRKGIPDGRYRSKGKVI